MVVRTTIHLDEKLLDRVRRVVPQRGLSRFVNEAVAEKMSVLERQQIEEAMKEGYLASWNADPELAADWEIVDLENWPE